MAGRGGGLSLSAVDTEILLQRPRPLITLNGDIIVSSTHAWTRVMTVKATDGIITIPLDLVDGNGGDYPVGTEFGPYRRSGAGAMAFSPVAGVTLPDAEVYISAQNKEVTLVKLGPNAYGLLGDTASGVPPVTPPPVTPGQGSLNTIVGAASGVTIPMPSGAGAGKALTFFIAWDTSDVSGSISLSDYTRVGVDWTGTIGMATFTRNWGTGETLTAPVLTWTGGGTRTIAYANFADTGLSPTAPIGDFDHTAQGTVNSSNPTAPAVTGVASGLVRLAVANSAGAVVAPPTGFTERVDTPAGVAAATPTYVASTAGAGGAVTTLPMTKPSGVGAGDVHILSLHVEDLTKTINLPVGWTAITTLTTAAVRGILAYKVEDGTGIGTITWDGTSIYADYQIDSYSGVSNTAPIAASDVFAGVSTAAPTYPTLTGLPVNSMIHLTAYNTEGHNVTGPATYTDRGINGFDMQTADKLLVAGGTTGTLTGTNDAGAEITPTVTIALKAAGSPTTIGLEVSEKTITTSGDTGAIGAGAAFTGSNRAWITHVVSYTPAASVPVPPIPASGMQAGVAVISSQLAADGAKIAQNFRVVVGQWEFKWDATEGTQNVFSYTGSNAIVDFAAANGMKVRGHTLTWYVQSPAAGGAPAWFVALADGSCRAAMENHIANVVGHFKTYKPGVVDSWDVTNEMLNDDGSFRTGYKLYTSMGTETVTWQGVTKTIPRYIRYALQAARTADPAVKLFLNEYGVGVEWADTGKVATMVWLGGYFKSVGLCDGVGIQCHLFNQSLRTVVQQIALLKQFTDLGLLVDYTECDVPKNVGNDVTTTPQQEGMWTVLEDGAKQGGVRYFMAWGFKDSDSWRGDAAAALLFDDTPNPKPSYTHLATLLGLPPPVTPPSSPGAFEAGLYYQWWNENNVNVSSVLHPKRVRYEVYATDFTAATDRWNRYVAQGILPQPLFLNADGVIPSNAQIDAFITWCSGRTGMKFVEIGNEDSYNFKLPLSAGLPTMVQYAKDYATMIKRLYQGPGGSNGLNSLGIGIIAQADPGNAGTAWVDAMFTQVPELSTYVKGWGVHLYGPTYMAKLNTMYSSLSGKTGASAIKAYVTELGIATDNGGAALSSNDGWPNPMTYQQVKDQLVIVFGDLMADSRVKQIMYYFDFDGQPTGHAAGAFYKDYFGVVQHDGLTPKGPLTPYIAAWLAAN